MARNSFGYNPELPEDIREIFMWLCQDVVSIHNKWNFYLGLFSRQENVDLLSYLAPSSFNIIEESLRFDLMMAICRLSDPPQTKGKGNLSLETLVQYFGEGDSINKLLKAFQEECKPVRNYRHKRVGHNDLNTRLKPRENPLPGIGRERIDKILQLARDILNTIYQRFVDGELYFKPVSKGGADALIYYLKIFKEHDEAKI